MSKIFTRTFRVRWSELDASGAVSSANYLLYLIETAWDWGDAVGLGVCLRQQPDLYIDYAEEAAAQEFAARGWNPARLREAGLRVVTRRARIQYLARAEWGETLNISTYVLEVNDTGGPRYVGMTRLDGASLAECILD